MSKSPDAFRTISEVSDWLGIQAHVLRFWESKFTQIKPVKRAGGRRHYRPSDMMLIGGIKKLLHDDGMTIKGVQKVLREQGIGHVSALSKAIDGPEDALSETANVVTFKRPPSPDVSTAAELAPASVPQPTVTAPERPSGPPPTEPSFYPASAEKEADSEEASPEPADDAPSQGALPGFLTRPLQSPAEPTTPRARVVDAADPPDDANIEAQPGCLSLAAGITHLSPETAAQMAPLLRDLRSLRDRISQSSDA